MALLDDITAEQGRATLRCNVAIAMDAIADDDRPSLKQAIDNSDQYRAVAIERALSKRHVPECTDEVCATHLRLPAQSVLRHRKGECACRT